LSSEQFEVRIAETREDIEGAIHLVYRNYVERGYCPPNRFSSYFYLFDMLPDTRTLVAVCNGAVAATLTLVFDSELGLPSERLYPKEIGNLRSAGRRLVEISKLSADKELGMRGMIALRELFRLAWLMSSWVKSMTDFVILVEPHHEKFYTKGMLFDRIGEVKADPDANGAPSILLRMDFLTAPSRYRKAFGEKSGTANLYRYYMLDPEITDLQAKAAEADKRLLEMHGKFERGGSRSAATLEERRYLDYRAFGIAMVVSKIRKEAERNYRKGFFDEVIKMYSKLLNALPSSHNPELRSRVMTDLAYAAWRCGQYEHSLSLAETARNFTSDPDTLARSHAVAAMDLYFLGRGAESISEISTGLAIKGISPLARANLLRCDGRLAIERSDIDLARKRLEEAIAILKEIPRSDEADAIHAIVAHNIWMLEIKYGNLLAAERALRECELYVDGSNALSKVHFLEAKSGTYQAMCRPAEAVAADEAALREIAVSSDPFNASVVLNRMAISLLDMGDIAAAHKAVDEAMKNAVLSKYAGVTADAFATLARIYIAEDMLSEARKTVDSGLDQISEAMSSRGRVNMLASKVRVASVEKDWDCARRCLRVINDRVGGIPEYKAYTILLEITTEMLAGDLYEARRLLEDAPDPGRFPGFAVYECGWKMFAGILASVEGREDDAAAAVGRSMALLRSGEAWHELASSALNAVEMMLALTRGDANMRIADLCFKEAAEACSRKKMPYCERRLKELSEVLQRDPSSADRLRQ
jgi:tetratricopeptide (TPR) repeat protein